MMARFKKALSIYIKESWLKDIQFFAAKQEESVSEYIERAVSFQLLHDRKAWEKENQKKENQAWLSVQNPTDLLKMEKEQWEEFIKLVGRAADMRTKAEIAKTRWISNDQND